MSDWPPPAIGWRPHSGPLAAEQLGDHHGTRISFVHGFTQTRNSWKAIAERFANPSRSLHELFARIVFNIATGNTDDHARNHAAFWDGKAHQLSLTPAYDICPYPRAGQTAEQIMAIGRDGSKASQFATCVAAAAVYGLSTADARDIVDHQVTTIRREWAEAADVARLTEADKTRMWGRDILNPYAFFDEP